MRVRKENTQFGTTISFSEKDRYITFSMGGNGDLYWTIRSRQGLNKYNFSITKENYQVYHLFEQLFDDIENINIFNMDDCPFFLESEEEKRKYFEQRRIQVEAEKRKYREYNHGNYNELYDKENKVITWYSDETAHEVANILRIKKEDEQFTLEFQTQPNIYGYDNDFKSPNHIPIRFRNSGSSYNPFNVVFMKMYNNMNNIDDVKDYGHQIDVEEYMYEQGKRLIKSR
jgi:hypothetical protein